MSRRLAVLLALASALAAAVPAAAQDDQVEEGRRLYVESCISCHGPQGEGHLGTGPGRGAEGIVGAGPSLQGVGAASVDWYLRTGRMPLREVGGQPQRGEPQFTRDQIDALIAYVTSLPGEGRPIPEPRPEEGDVGRGLTAFTDKCAGCHQIVGEAGVVVEGVAPELDQSNPIEIAEAVRIGPFVMPAFDETAIDEQELNDIIAYIRYTREPEDEGGWPIGHLGPIPEGLVAWLIGIGALIAVSLVIGERLRR